MSSPTLYYWRHNPYAVAPAPRDRPEISSTAQHTAISDVFTGAVAGNPPPSYDDASFRDQYNVSYRPFSQNLDEPSSFITSEIERYSRLFDEGSATTLFHTRLMKLVRENFTQAYFSVDQALIFFYEVTKKMPPIEQRNGPWREQFRALLNVWTKQSNFILSQQTDSRAVALAPSPAISHLISTVADGEQTRGNRPPELEAATENIAMSRGSAQHWLQKNPKKETIKPEVEDYFNRFRTDESLINDNGFTPSLDALRASNLQKRVLLANKFDIKAEFNANQELIRKLFKRQSSWIPTSAEFIANFVKAANTLPFEEFSKIYKVFYDQGVTTVQTHTLYLNRLISVCRQKKEAQQAEKAKKHNDIKHEEDVQLDDDATLLEINKAFTMIPRFQDEGWRKSVLALHKEMRELVNRKKR